MAKINFGALVSDARGKIDGIVYSRNGSGAYVRTKVTPVNKNTVRQQAARAALAANSKMYSAILTDAQRGGFGALAASNPVTDIFGNSQTLSAIAMFGRVNNVLRNIGEDPLADAPANMNVTGITSLDITGDEALQGLKVAFTATPLEATTLLYVFATGKLNPGRTFYKQNLTFLGAAAAATVSPFDIAALWIAKYGALVEGDKIGFQVATVNSVNGAISAGLGQLVTIAAA